MKNSRSLLERDLENMFGDRLAKLLQDTADTCQRADLSREQFVLLVTVSMWFQLATISRASGVSQQTFTKRAALVWQKAEQFDATD